MKQAMAKRNQKYLNLFQIRLPLPGQVSFLHRVSGALLFLVIPFILVLLGRSLDSPGGFAAVFDVFLRPGVRIAALILLWAYLHHLFAGIRFLLLDLHVGATLTAARLSAGIVLWAAIVSTAVIGALLW